MEMPIQPHRRNLELISFGVDALQLERSRRLAPSGRNDRHQLDALLTSDFLCLALVSPYHQRLGEHHHLHRRAAPAGIGAMSSGAIPGLPALLVRSPVSAAR